MTLGALPSAAALNSVFSQIDVNNDGIITRAEWNEAVRVGIVCETSSQEVTSSVSVSQTPLGGSINAPSGFGGSINASSGFGGSVNAPRICTDGVAWAAPLPQRRSA